MSERVAGCVVRTHGSVVFWITVGPLLSSEQLIDALETRFHRQQVECVVDRRDILQFCLVLLAFLLLLLLRLAEQHGVAASDSSECQCSIAGGQDAFVRGLTNNAQVHRRRRGRRFKVGKHRWRQFKQGVRNVWLRCSIGQICLGHDENKQVGAEMVGAS